MAACGSIHHIFEKPILPESPSLLSSWNHLKSINEQQSSFTELFGELHFKENSPSSSSPSSSSSSSSSSSAVSSFIDLISSSSETETKSSENNNKPILSPIKNYGESLQLCTEGLGFESFDDVEDLKNEEYWQQQQVSVNKRRIPEKKLRCGGGGGGFPPPISSIGKSGKPWISFKSYRHDGRFVLKQVKMPSQEILHAHREDGRLKLHFVQPIIHHDDILHEQEDEQQDEQEDDQEQEEDQEETVCSNVK